MVHRTDACYHSYSEVIQKYTIHVCARNYSSQIPTLKYLCSRKN